MKTCQILQTDLTVSRIAFGCTMLAPWDHEALTEANISQAERIVGTACDHGITLFDHADLYAFGKSEEVFGRILKRTPGLRQRIVIQSKCGQRFPDNWKPGGPIHVDVRREHILNSVAASLRRLGTDYIDLLLLHVCDPLAQPEEIAKAFDELKASGMVRYFGVSNHSAPQIALLKRHVRVPLVVNQVRVGLGRPELILDGMEFTMGLCRGEQRSGAEATYRQGGTLDYCRLNDIQIQAWSPLRGGILNSPRDARAEMNRLARLLIDTGRDRGVAPGAIALAWLLQHPAAIVPIMSSMDPEHIRENCFADTIELTREEWFALWVAAGAAVG